MRVIGQRVETVKTTRCVWTFNTLCFLREREAEKGGTESEETGLLERSLISDEYRWELKP